MPTKRGPARTSNALKRKLRFRKKHTHHVTPVRMKELLAEAKALLEEWLVNYDAVEVQVLEDLEGKLPATLPLALPPMLPPIPGVPLLVESQVCEVFFADSPRIIVDAVAGNKAIKTGFSITAFPSDAILDYVRVYVFGQVVENAAGGAANAINGEQQIQIQKAVGGVWTNAATILDGAFNIPKSTRDMRKLLGAPLNCKSEVDGNGSYNLRWMNALALVDSLNFDDVFFIVVVSFHYA